MLAVEYDFNERDMHGIARVRFTAAARAELRRGLQVVLYDPAEAAPGLSALGVVLEFNRRSLFARVMVDMGSIGGFPRR